MATVLDYCSLVRSKTAGPFTLTFDFLAKNEETYGALCASGVLTPRLFASLFHAREADVDVTRVPLALAIKVSLPRPVVQGSLRDADSYAGQQYGPLMDLEIPS